MTGGRAQPSDRQSRRPSPRVAGRKEAETDPAESPSSAHVKPRFTWPTLTTVFQVLGIAAVVGYGLLLSAYDRFYGSFGLRPEEVGIDRATIAARTLGALPLFVLPLLAVVGFVTASISFRRERKARARWQELEQKRQELIKRTRAPGSAGALGPAEAAISGRQLLVALGGRNLAFYSCPALLDPSEQTHPDNRNRPSLSPSLCWLEG